MFKILGAACVLIAAVGCANFYVDRQKRRVKMLQSLVSMSETLAGAIGYERLTAEEALGRLRKQYRDAAGEAAGMAADRLAAGNCASFESAWREAFLAAEPELMISEEEMDIVLEMGKHLGGADVETQERHLRRCGQEMREKLSVAGRELSEKRRLYRSLGIAVGILTALILV